MAPATTMTRRTANSGVVAEEPFLLATFSSPVPPAGILCPEEGAANEETRRSRRKKKGKTSATAAAQYGHLPPLATLSAVVDNASPSAAVSTTASSTDDDDRCPDLVLGVTGVGIHTFNTSSQKRTSSYPAPPGFRLRGPARAQSFAKTTNIYAALEAGPAQDVAEGDAGKVVWRWEETERDGFGSKTTHKLPKPIHSLELSQSLSDKYVMLVQTDGSLTLIHEDLSRVLASCDAPRPGLRAAWSTTHLCSDNSVRVFVVLLDLQGNTEVAWYNVDSEGPSITLGASGTVPLQNDNGAAVAYTFDPSLRQFSFVSAIGELVVYRLDILPRKQTSHCVFDPVQMLRIPLKTSVCATQVTPLPPASCALAVAGPSYLAVLLPSPRSRSSFNLLIWDTQHGTVQTEIPINLRTCEDKVAPAGESRFQLQLCAMITSSRLVSAVTQVDDNTAHTSVVVCEYECQRVSLLGAMGMMKITRSHVANLEDDSNVEDTLAKAPSLATTPVDPEAVIDEWNTLVDDTSKAELAVANQALALLYDGNTSEFDKAFFRHVLPGGPVLKKSDTPLSSAFAARIVRALFPPLSDKKALAAVPPKWPRKAMVYLFEHGYIQSCDVVGGLVRRLVAREDWELLADAITHIKDIPETDLVYLMRVLLGSNQSNEKLPFYAGPLRRRLLRLFASSPRNDVAMISALKTLTAPELVAWMTQIVQWLKGWASTAAIERSISKECAHKVPTANRLLANNMALGDGKDADEMTSRTLRSTDAAKKHGEPRSKEVDELLEVLRTLRQPPPEETEYPPLVDVLDHAILLLDSKFPSLVLAPEVHDSLEALSMAVGEQVALCEGLEAMRGPLTMFWLNQEYRERSGGGPRHESRRGDAGKGYRPPGIDVQSSGGVGAYAVEILRV